MRFMVLIYSNPESRQLWQDFTPEQRSSGLATYATLREDRR
jgi:hypothetical protein